MPFKEPWEREGTYVGLLFMALWSAAGAFLFWNSRRPETRDKAIGRNRDMFPLFVLVALFGFWAIFDGAVRYVDTCRNLLDVK